MRKLRKLTISIYVDQDSKEWHWLYDTLKPREISFDKGMCVRAIRDGFMHEDTEDALIWAHNSQIQEKRRLREGEVE